MNDIHVWNRTRTYKTSHRYNEQPVLGPSPGSSLYRGSTVMRKYPWGQPSNRIRLFTAAVQDQSQMATDRQELFLGPLDPRSRSASAPFRGIEWSLRAFASMGAQRFSLRARALTKTSLASNEHSAKNYLYQKPSMRALVKICEHELKRAPTKMLRAIRAEA